MHITLFTLLFCYVFNNVTSGSMWFFDVTHRVCLPVQTNNVMHGQILRLHSIEVLTLLLHIGKSMVFTDAIQRISPPFPTQIRRLRCKMPNAICLMSLYFVNDENTLAASDQVHDTMLRAFAKAGLKLQIKELGRNSSTILWSMSTINLHLNTLHFNLWCMG